MNGCLFAIAQVCLFIGGAIVVLLIFANVVIRDIENERWGR